MHRLLAEKEKMESSLHKALSEKEAVVASYNKLFAEKELADATYNDTIMDVRQQYSTELDALKSRHLTELETLRLRCDEQSTEHMKKLTEMQHSADATLAVTRRTADEEKANLLSKIR